MSESNLSDESRAAKISEVLDAHNIHGIVFDLDDTISKTNQMFILSTSAYRILTSATFGIDLSQFEAEFRKASRKAQSVSFVNPNRWNFVIEELNAAYGHAYDFSVHRDILMSVYSTVPELHDGAIELLDLLRQCDRRLGLVTHATEAWTRLKLETLGLTPYFDAVVIADENRPKNSEDWAQCLLDLDLPGHQAIAVGDNVIGDIRAAHEVGYRYQVHVPPAWSHYGEGELPEGAFFSLDGIKGVADVLIENLG